jgi:hypothetical protein
MVGLPTGDVGSSPTLVCFNMVVLKNAIIKFEINNYMNYLNIYNKLQLKAKNRILTGYKETHHIIPRCLGGADDISNLVDLTPEEHYIAHLLLVKIYPENRQLVHAAVMMTVNGKDQCRNNKLYGWLRRKHAESISISQSGIGNSQFGRYWIYNVETDEVRRIYASDTIPAGWIRGKTGYTKCEVCGDKTGSKQRRFCLVHKPKSIPPKSPMAKGSRSAIKLSKYCKSRTKEQHPQFGKRWVHTADTQLMVPKDKLDEYLGAGWNRGKLKAD